MAVKEVDPATTKRALSYRYFINAPMPMVTLFKTIRVTNLLKLSQSGYKFTMLMCYYIGLAAEALDVFYLLPVGQKMYQYDRLGINVIVANKDGGINSCDIPFHKDLDTFNQAYLSLTERVAQTAEDYAIEGSMMIGTSTLVKYDLDGVVNMYSGIFNNPFLIWGKYQDSADGTVLKLSFQFHHVQMDGEHACHFLERLQQLLDNIAQIPQRHET